MEEAPLYQQQASAATENVLAAIVDKLIVAAIFVYIVSLAMYAVYAAFNTFPLVKMSTSALTSFLLAIAAIPLIIRYANMIYIFARKEQNNTQRANDGLNAAFAIGSGVVCIALAIEVVNSIIFANSLSISQQFLAVTSLIAFGFQLRRILLRQ